MAGWREFYSRQPFGSYRDNLHTAMIASILVNQNRRKGTKPIDPSQFLIMERSQKTARDTATVLAWFGMVAKPKGK